MTTRKRAMSRPVDGLVLRAPSVTHCPFCCAGTVRHYGCVPRCMTCHAVFFVSFSRYTRKSPSKRQDKEVDHEADQPKNQSAGQP